MTEQTKTIKHESLVKINNGYGDVCNEMFDIDDDDNAKVTVEYGRDKIRKINCLLAGRPMILFIGPFSSGKTSLINPLLGTEILPCGDRPCTSIVTEISFVHGGGHRGKAVRLDGQEELISNYSELVAKIDGGNISAGASAAYHHIELLYDTTALAEKNDNLELLFETQAVIVDAPGYGDHNKCAHDAVINEYISKASCIFWVIACTHLGVAGDIEALDRLAGKSKMMIPVLSMSDTLKDDEDKVQCLEDFNKSYGKKYFPGRKPIFTSAKLYKQYLEAVKNPKPNENAYSQYYLPSGFQNILNAVAEFNTNESVSTDGRIQACKDQEMELAQYLKLFIQKKIDMLSMGSKTEDSQKQKQSADIQNWIQAETERVLETFKPKYVTVYNEYLDSPRKNKDLLALKNTVQDILLTEIAQREEDWIQYFQSLYNTPSQTVIHEEENTNIKMSLPHELAGDNMQKILHDRIQLALQALTTKGVGTVACGGLGYALWCSMPLLGGIAGASLLAPAVGALGIGFMVLSLCIPTEFMMKTVNKANAKSEEKKTAIINKWLEAENMNNTVGTIISNLLKDMNLKASEAQINIQKKGNGSTQQVKMNHYCNLYKQIEQIENELREMSW